METCAYKQIEYYSNCKDCPADESFRCYVTRKDLEEHLKLFQETFHPRLKKFYLRNGINWKQHNWSLQRSSK